MHGSDVCWRKFLNAAGFYGVDTLIMGGDLCGKGLTPVVRENGGWKLPLAGEERYVSTRGGARGAGRARAAVGPLSPPDEPRRNSTASRPTRRALDEMFETALVEGVRRWMEMADERLENSESIAYVMPGNDDPWAIDAALADRSRVVACDDKIVRVGEHEMLSLGWANETPWHTDRELDEPALYERIKQVGRAARESRQLDLQHPRSATWERPGHRDRTG